MEVRRSRSRAQSLTPTSTLTLNLIGGAEESLERPEARGAGTDSGYDTAAEGKMLSAGDMFGHLSLFTGRSAHCQVVRLGLELG